MVCYNWVAKVPSQQPSCKLLVVIGTESGDADHHNVCSRGRPRFEAAVKTKKVNQIRAPRTIALIIKCRSAPNGPVEPELSNPDTGSKPTESVQDLARL